MNTTTKGRLFLVPTPLDFGTPGQTVHAAHDLPEATWQQASRLSHWVCENAKTTRAFLKRADARHPLATALQAQNLQELPREAHKKGDHQPGGPLDSAARTLLQPALEGHDMGLVCEAGMPAIADPGSSVVRAAHALGLRVVPLIGPVSLMLALAASGLNGQQFAFVGYLPQDAAQRQKQMRSLEQLAHNSGQSQLVIETPYRNAALLQALEQQLQADTRLAVCSGLTLANEWIRSAPVADWRRLGPAFKAGLDLSAPTVFVFGR